MSDGLPQIMGIGSCCWDEDIIIRPYLDERGRSM